MDAISFIDLDHCHFPSILRLQFHVIMLRSNLFFILFALLLSCQSSSQKQSEMEHKYTNALVNESSPYLLQHAHNPVDWHAWNDKTLSKAKDENKLIIISVGYSACHWCHVMEHESFEDSTVAALMNEHFVPIKVDREERPDIDDVYMTACQLTSGRGCGWPLNAFALSDGRPIWAGTYFPKDQWMKILNQFIQLKLTSPSQLREYADNLEEGYRSVDAVEIPLENTSIEDVDMTATMAMFKNQIDAKYGGRKGAPKFPMPNNYETLLKYGHLNGDKSALNLVYTTLNNMSSGGIFDAIAGGFARYSTDAIWKVPHFEKMLYDNGQLLDIYSYAFKKTKDPTYKKTIDKTVNWIKQEMIDESGGIYSALDADSEGEEGKFYVWKHDEISNAISDETARSIFVDRFEITKSGNWEHDKNILHVKMTLDQLAKKYDMTEKEIEKSIDESLQVLKVIRDKRVRPGLDDKILTSWNALASHGLIEAYFSTGNNTAFQLAADNMAFLLKHQVQKNGQLWRNYKNGKSTINAFLDDYALLVRALIKYYEATLDEKYLFDADRILSFAETHFSDDTTGLFYYTSDLDPPLVTRKRELADNVIPSSNSIMARNLLHLGLYLYKPAYIKRAEKMAASMKSAIFEGQQPSFYSNWLQLYMDLIEHPYEVAIVGDKSLDMVVDWKASYLPNAMILGGKKEGNLQLLKDKLQAGATMIYVCRNKVCKFPVEEVSAAMELVQ